MNKTLVAGWFSFELMGATAGDLLARDLACEWLEQAGHLYDVAHASPFSDGVDWREVRPEDYSHVVFVCGPLGNGEPVAELFQRFARCRLVGLNLSMLESLDAWNPFEFLWERDSSVTARPDISFFSQQAQVPVVGVILIHPQPEYKEKDLHELTNDAIQRLVAANQMAAVNIDTRLDTNSTGLRTPLEVESLIARMDVVLTTRLHGMVLALKNCVPVLAIDPVAGGHKILRQARTVGWPTVFTAGDLRSEVLQQAFDYCLTQDGRAKAKECRDRAIDLVEELRKQFISSLAGEKRRFR